MKPAARTLAIGAALCAAIGVISRIVGATTDTPSTAVAAGALSTFMILLAGVGVVGLLAIRAIVQELDDRLPAKPKRSPGLGMEWASDPADDT
jgi:hypothetical protein